MDPFNVTVVGSRYPISVPSTVQPVRPFSQLGSTQSTSSSVSSSKLVHSSRIRRKPIQTYKSPSVNDGFRIDRQNDAQHVPPSFSSSSRTSSSNSERPDRPATNSNPKPPSLPLYHPLGRLAQSLPALDPRVFGIQNSVSVDDNDMQIDDADIRRSSSRARKPAAKLRDRDREEGDDQASINGTSAVNGTAERETRPATSPRKRRAAGAGGAGGPKRRRRDTDDPSGTFPQPTRRTRNPRGAAVASPLAGVAVAATDAGDDGDSPAPMDAPDLQTVVLQAQEARPTRSTRSRAPLKRRDSSASTSTSISVSIAIHAQQTRIAVPRVDDVPVRDVEMDDATPQGKGKEPAEMEGAQAEKKGGVDNVEENVPVGAANETESKDESKEVLPTVPITSDAAPETQPKDAGPDIIEATSSEPSVTPTTTESKPVEQNGPKSNEEEKEEGELSDGR